MTRFVKTFSLEGEGGGVVHIHHPKMDNTLCGLDTSGDPEVHRKDPEMLGGRHNVTCPHCRVIIESVKQFLKGK